jgi:hypothetical protein
MLFASLSIIRFLECFVLHVSCDCKDRRKLQGILYAKAFDEVVTKLGLLVPQDGRTIKQIKASHRSGSGVV